MRRDREKGLFFMRKKDEIATDDREAKAADRV